MSTFRLHETTLHLADGRLTLLRCKTALKKLIRNPMRLAAIHGIYGCAAASPDKTVPPKKIIITNEVGKKKLVNIDSPKVIEVDIAAVWWQPNENTADSGSEDGEVSVPERPRHQGKTIQLIWRDSARTRNREILSPVGYNGV